MKMQKNTFELVFNDRAFEDGWAEPYIVKVTTSKLMKIDELRNNINEAIKSAENSEDGMFCSIEGIEQIFSYLSALITSFEVYQLDDNFEFGRDI
ncbi:TPA: hypothetical protein N2D99_002065 [Clostridium botulinum]|nr:hypothetical protein [Clostridium botulinum]